MSLDNGTIVRCSNEGCGARLRIPEGKPCKFIRCRKCRTVMPAFDQSLEPPINEPKILKNVVSPIQDPPNVTTRKAPNRPERRPKAMLSWFGWAIFGGLAFVAIYFGHGENWRFLVSETDTTDHRPVPAPADKEFMQGIGYVEPISEVRKLSLRTGGVVRSVFVSAGDKVRKGDRLLELENGAQLADAEVAKKNVEVIRAEAHHIKAGVNPLQIKVIANSIDKLQEKARFHRAEAARSVLLRQSKATSAQDHENIEVRLRQAEGDLKEKEAELTYLRNSVTAEQAEMMDAKVRHAKATLELALERVRETLLLAPFDGVVLKVLKKEGEGVRSSEPDHVILFGDLSKKYVRAEIDERHVQDLTVGQIAEIFGRNLGKDTYRGRVISVEPIMGDKTVFSRTSPERKDLDVVQALIELNESVSAPIGLQVDVRIERGRRSMP